MLTLSESSINSGVLNRCKCTLEWLINIGRKEYSLVLMIENGFSNYVLFLACRPDTACSAYNLVLCMCIFLFITGKSYRFTKACNNDE